MPAKARHFSTWISGTRQRLRTRRVFRWIQPTMAANGALLTSRQLVSAAAVPGRAAAVAAVVVAVLGLAWADFFRRCWKDSRRAAACSPTSSCSSGTTSSRPSPAASPRRPRPRTPSTRRTRPTTSTTRRARMPRGRWAASSARSRGHGSAICTRAGSQTPCSCCCTAPPSRPRASSAPSFRSWPGHPLGACRSSRPIGRATATRPAPRPASRQTPPPG
mmetsp:Transcript_64843/g.200817  ORF Transcript_64843/g.200817 Transcript_64843/m.200817 type:complete len:219 (-) Transcript_64843:575-1231(-)